MPEIVPLDPAKVAALLAEAQGGDLHHLALTLGHVQPAEHGFSARDVVRVESTWAMMDIDYLQGDYVVRLQDGRRFCIHYFIDDLPPELRPDDSVGHREGIDVEALAADQRYPKLDPDGTSWGWSDEVEELNTFLDRGRQ
jgi:hypothetical protein